MANKLVIYQSPGLTCVEATAVRFVIPILLIALAGACVAAPSTPVDVYRIPPASKACVVGDIYGVGYDGWGDITTKSGIAHLKGVGVKHCRIDVNLKELCGARYGDYNWEYTTAHDLGMGFISRIKQIRRNGWVPIIALSSSFALPSWFHGDPTDSAGNPWVKYNLDGTVAPDGHGNQFDELTRIAHDIAARLAAEGIRGQMWETIYELGHTMPLDEIHYAAAKGIKEADRTAILTGPATWPGWTVEERFAKPYLTKYGPDLLDYVTVHWYGSNEHELWDMGYKPDTDIITMADTNYLRYLMGITPKYAEWCRTLRKVLGDRKLNPSGKRIGIIYTEYDLNAQSPYQKNPENRDWPKYRADADCYINTNYFGAVWCSSILCNLAADGRPDIVCKFNTRTYYGLMENGPKDTYYRMPVWFAWRLLQQKAGLTAGAKAQSVPAVTKTPSKDTPEVFAVRNPHGLRLIVINKTFGRRTVAIRPESTKAPIGAATRYVLDRSRTAQFIGRKPGTTDEGHFQGAPDDSANLLSLKPVDRIVPTGKEMRISCPPISVTVLVFGASVR